MNLRLLVAACAVCALVVTTAFGQNRDFRAERLVIDDNNGNTVVIQTGPGPITGGTLTIPDPGGAGMFLISNPSGGSQSVTGDFLPGTDATYDLGTAASRWRNIFLSGNATIGGQVWYQETGGGTDYVGFQAPAAVAASQIWTLPAADGSSGDVLTTDGSGVLSWATGGATGAAGGDLTGTYPNPTIANDAVTSAKIQDGQVQNSDLSANAVTTSKVANGTVTTSKLADSAVSGLKLLTFAVTNRHLASNAVTPDKIDPTGASSGNVITYNGTNVVWATASGTVNRNATLVGDGSVGTPLGINLANSNTWTANQTFAGTFLITANSRIAMTNSDNNARDLRLQEPSGTGSQYVGIRAPSVANNGNYVLPAVMGTAGQVLALATSNGLDSGSMEWTTVSSGATGAAGGDLTGTYPNPTIANDAVTSAKIQDGQVQNADLSANSVTTSKVANGTVTTSKLADSAVSGLKLLTFAVTNRHLASNAVTPDKIDPTGATSGDVLSYNGTSVVWTAASGGGTVNRNATLVGDGSVGTPLGINLANSNTWTANQTFAGTFLITANSRIAMTNSDNNARDLRLQEPSGTGSQYVGIRAPSVANNGNYVLPAVMGTAGQVLALATSNGLDSGSMEWTTVSSGATGAAGGDLTGTYPNPTIANDAVTSAKIQDGQVQNSDLSANSVTTSKVANGTVTTSKLADSAVSGLKLLTFAVTNRHLASNAVTPDKISSTGAADGNVLRYNGSNVVWGAPQAGGSAFNHTVVSATTYSVATTDDIIGCDVSSNGITITLPAANGVPAGKTLIIRVENGDASVSGRSITINRNGTDLINYSQTSLTINQGTGIPGTVFRLYSDGVNQWWQW